MANVAVLASGSGSNFEAIADALEGTNHRICCLVCDRREARVFDRAKRRGIPAFYIPYYRRERSEAEEEVRGVLDRFRPDLIALAGFMRILTPAFVDTFAGKIVNIHPALLPSFPGAHGLEESYHSGNTELGITIHFVDHGTDTGPIIRQASIVRQNGETLGVVEERIHQLEHRHYPEVVLTLLDRVE
jgi:phosphoribosylglycinamide formyltransferase-1